MSFKDKLKRITDTVNNKKKGTWGDVALRGVLLLSLFFFGKYVWQEISLKYANEIITENYRNSVRQHFVSSCYEGTWERAMNIFAENIFANPSAFTKVDKEAFSSDAANIRCDCLFSSLVDEVGITFDHNFRDLASLKQTLGSSVESKSRQLDLLLEHSWNEHIDTKCSKLAFKTARSNLLKKYTR